MSDYYAVGYGLQEHDFDYSKCCVYAIDSRQRFCSMIRNEIKRHNLPQYYFGRVGVRNLWQHLKQRGSSCAPFYVTHKDMILCFYGLTENELLKLDLTNKHGKS